MHKRCIQMQCNCTNKLSKVRLRNWICFSSGVLRNTCAASDQVAESYDLARATLATKLATMSTKNECTISRNSLHWRSNTRNYTPQAFWWRPSFACSTRSPRCYPKGQQHSSQRRLDAHKQLAQKNAFQWERLKNNCSSVLPLLRCSKSAFALTPRGWTRFYGVGFHHFLPAWP